jgi:predicted chitinase
LEITKEQLKAIFPKTNEKRLEEVVKAINANSSTFDIGTPERMAHFIGQIGAETGGLNKLREDFFYSPRGVAKTFPYTHYGHLYENVVLDSTTYSYTYNPINFDENNCKDEMIPRGGAVFPYKNSSEIMNAYASTKADTLIVTLNNKKIRIPVYKMRTDVTKLNIGDMVKDGEYNSGLLRVKKCYIRSPSLFDVTYACRLGNGNIASKDGSTFLGKGFIHITGKGGYKDISTEWNKLYPHDKKEFHGKDITLLETNVEIAIKASMDYWKLKSLNEKADLGTSPTIVEKIGRTVNGGNNGMDLRQKYTKLAANNLK